MPTLQQADLFTAYSPARPEEKPAPKPRPNRMADTSHAARRRLRRGGMDTSVRGRCLAEIKSNSRFGLTRQEIADRSGIKLQSVCGAVNRLVHDGDVFEPIDGTDADGRLLHYRRAGGKVAVAALYESAWVALAHRRTV